MANYAKYTKAGIVGLLRHNAREKNADGVYIRHKNIDINPKRTTENYDLSRRYESGAQQYQRIKKRLGDLQYRSQKNNVVCCSWAVTAPQDLKPEDTKRFFMAAREFLCDRYGAENEISAYVHMDETTPHMHWTFVPATKDGRLRASRVVTRDDLAGFHPQMEAHIEQALGYHVQLCDPDRDKRAKGKTKSIQQLKADTAKVQAEYQAVFKQLQTAQELLDDVEVLKDVKKSFGSLEGLRDGFTDALDSADYWELERTRLEEALSILGVDYQTVLQRAEPLLSYRMAYMQNRDADTYPAPGEDGVVMSAMEFLQGYRDAIAMDGRGGLYGYDEMAMQRLAMMERQLAEEHEL